jgi:hypothetical protein
MIMSDLLSELFTQARTLPGFEIETAWDSEILRRLGEVERGVAILIPAEDVFAEARRITQ